MKRPDFFYDEQAVPVDDDASSNASSDDGSLVERESAFILDSVCQGLSTAKALARKARLMVQNVFSGVEVLYGTGMFGDVFVTISGLIDVV